MRSNDAGPEEDRSNPGIFDGLSLKPVEIFVFAGTNQLEPDDRLTIADQIETWAATPRQVVRKIVLVRAAAATSRKKSAALHTSKKRKGRLFPPEQCK